MIALITEWRDENGELIVRDEKTDLGGTMRLGAQRCELIPGSRAALAYGKTEISERHRHRYEFNNGYQKVLEEAGMVFSGFSAENHLVETIELPEHPFFIASQFHPEFNSTPRDGHPLFTAFIQAALAQRAGGADEEVAE